MIKRFAFTPKICTRTMLNEFRTFASIRCDTLSSTLELFWHVWKLVFCVFLVCCVCVFSSCKCLFLLKFFYRKDLFSICVQFQKPSLMRTIMWPEISAISNYIGYFSAFVRAEKRYMSVMKKFIDSVNIGRVKRSQLQIWISDQFQSVFF